MIIEEVEKARDAEATVVDNPAGFVHHREERLKGALAAARSHATHFVYFASTQEKLINVKKKVGWVAHKKTMCQKRGISTRPNSM